MTTEKTEEPEKKEPAAKKEPVKQNQAPEMVPTTEEVLLNREQIIENAQELFGRPTWVIEVAIKRFSANGETMTAESVKDALTQFDNHTVTAE